MANFVRARIPGGTYFFTLVTHKRQPLFRSPVAIDHFRQAYRQVSMAHPFATRAIVVLPDHLHAIWSLPSGDADYPLRWQLIKARTTRLLRRAYPDLAGPLWQRRYWEHSIRDARDLARHMDYIAYNPVKHGLVTLPWYWPHGSFRRLVRKGLYARNWGMSEPPNTRGMHVE